MVYLIMTKNEKKFIEYNEQQKIEKLKEKSNGILSQLTIAMYQSKKFNEQEISDKNIYYWKKLN
jgi:hypothetical protein